MKATQESSRLHAETMQNMCRFDRAALPDQANGECNAGRA
jgi:hypothetical protein